MKGNTTSEKTTISNVHHSEQIPRIGRHGHPVGSRGRVQRTQIARIGGEVRPPKTTLSPVPAAFLMSVPSGSPTTG